ncbi:hypothetical protein BH11PSE12_BH11PSE12_22270 [soil metagenome]
MHDSRAWFKPFGNDIPDLLHVLELLSAAEEIRSEWESHEHNEREQPRKLSDKDRRRVLQYRQVKGTPAQLDLITPDKTGREPTDPGFMQSWFVVPGGYLRYRRIYMGSDSFKPKGAQYAGLAPAHAKDSNTLMAVRKIGPEKEPALSAT